MEGRLRPPTDQSEEPDFVTVATLTTSAGGAGAVEFERSGGPTISFDLFLRVIGDDGTVLEAGAWSLLESDPGVAPRAQRSRGTGCGRCALALVNGLYATKRGERPRHLRSGQSATRLSEDHALT
jgi:hypothetical protein